MLELDENNLKGVYHQIKSLILLQRYEEALELMKNKKKLIDKNT